MKNETSSVEMWTKLKKISGQKVRSQIDTIINSDNSIISDPKTIADVLANTFALNSSDINFDKNFLRYKRRNEEISRLYHSPRQPSNQ